MIYKVFVDDSGSNNYKTPYSREFVENPPKTNKYLQFYRDNYFVICAVVIKQENLDFLNSEINKIKYKYFKTHKVEIKSDWLRNPIQRKKYYIDPFKMVDKNLNEFGLKIIDFIKKNREMIDLVGIVFDKRYYSDKLRSKGDGNPLLKTCQVLFERIEYHEGENYIVFDQVEESLRIDEGKHGKILGIYDENRSMEKVHVKQYKHIKDVSFARSDVENFLQISDICAYNLYRQFVEHGREWERNSKLPMYEYFKEISKNFIHKDGEVRGVGIVCLPDIKKIKRNLRI